MAAGPPASGVYIRRGKRRNFSVERDSCETDAEAGACGDLRAIRIGLIALAVLALAATALRVFEFTALNCRWSDNAYSSTIWVLIGMHSGHLVTELIETVVLMVLSFTDKMEGMRLADVAINSDYWYFVVISGFLVDFVIYGTTRFL